MKRLKFILIILGLLLLPFGLKVKGQDFGQGQSLFSDVKAHKVGDILTVLVFEDSRATQSVETKTDKSTSASTSGGPGIGPLDFIPLFGVDADNSSSFNGKGENTRKGQLRARMSVTVIEVRTNGDLVIQGSRAIGINGDRETLTLNGVVRQRDVTPGNTIDSYLIADAEIAYSGKGAGNTASRPGFFTRFLNWLF